MASDNSIQLEDFGLYDMEASDTYDMESGQNELCIEGRLVMYRDRGPVAAGTRWPDVMVDIKHKTICLMSVCSEEHPDASAVTAFSLRAAELDLIVEKCKG